MPGLLDDLSARISRGTRLARVLADLSVSHERERHVGVRLLRASVR
jgi:hypothetical protein